MSKTFGKTVVLIVVVMTGITQIVTAGQKKNSPVNHSPYTEGCIPFYAKADNSDLRVVMSEHISPTLK